MKKVLYAGSFDPITKGHEDVIEKASIFFDEVIVAILNNPDKKSYFFSPEERYNLISKIYKEKPNIKVLVSDKPAVDVALENNCVGLVRGLRTITDYEEEMRLNYFNKEKEIYNLGKDISRYVDGDVYKNMLEKKKVL